MGNSVRDDLVEAAISKLNPQSSLDDICTIASIVKSQAESSESNANAANASKKLRFEFYQSLSSVFVPVVSLLALVGTVALQAYQIHLTRVDQVKQITAQRQAHLDDEWNDFLKTLTGGSSNYLSDPSLAPRLRYFIEDTNHKAQALDVARSVMGNMTDDVEFEQLLRDVFPSVNPSNLDKYITLYQMRTRSQNKLRLECRNLTAKIAPNYSSGQYWYEGLCFSTVSEDETLGAVVGKPDGARMFDLKQQMEGYYDEEVLMSNTIAGVLRALLSTNLQLRQQIHRVVDVRGIRLYNCNLSNVDFTYVNVSGSILDGVDLKGSRITDSSAFVDIRASNWWAAAEIDRKSLGYLMEHDYPYYPEQTGTDYPVSVVEYDSQIQRLCRPYSGLCQSKPKFGIP